jgi:predicted acylesterase/phospholipase RssA
MPIETGTLGHPGPLPTGTLPDKVVFDLRMYVDGVFKGGGSLGAAYPGALRALASRGIWFRRVAGTSAGAIISSMIAAGYSAAEIEYLSGPAELGLGRPAGLPAELAAHEIDYKFFVDIPTVLDLARRREYRTSEDWVIIRWVLDKLLDAGFDLPGRDRLLDDLRDRVINTCGAPARPFANALHDAFDGLVPRRISIGGVFDGNARDGIADACFIGGLIASGPQVLNPAAMVEWALAQEFRVRLAHLGVTGGMCVGQTFLDRIERVLAAKVHHDGPFVKFKDLPIDLFVTCTNATKQRLVVYSKKRTPEFRVAEAVRRSMSVPFVWERRVQQDHDGEFADAGDELIDGGVLDNLPIWVFLVPTNTIVTNDAGDLARLKLVFNLDGGASANPAWQAPPPPSSPLPSDPFGAFMNCLKSQPVAATWEAQLIRRLYRYYEVSTNGGAVGWSLAQAYPTPGSAVAAVDIPLDGFGWLDWDTSVPKFKAMAFRGWQATTDVVMAAGLHGGGVIQTTVPPINPYR